MSKRPTQSRKGFVIEPLNWVSPERRKELAQQEREPESSEARATERKD